MSTIYPVGYDTDETMPTVRNDVMAELIEDLLPGADSMRVSDPALFNPNGGYCTVYSFHDAIHADQRAGTFSYQGISGDKITGLTPLRSGGIIRSKGCKVYGNIMAEHRNDLVDAAIALEKDLGNVGTENRLTVEWFAHLFVSKVKKPRTWFDVLPSSHGFVFMPFRFKDRTTRLEEWQTVSWDWTFGDGAVSTERDPTHVYERPGRYTVTLTVTNDYGSTRRVIKNCIAVLGEMPDKCDTFVDPPNAIAGESVVTMSCKPAMTSDPVNPVNRIEWLTGQGEFENPKIGTYVRTIFEKAGIYQSQVTQRTVYGNFTSQLTQPINVVERGSTWVMIQQRFNPNSSIDEYMPSSKSWKTGRGDFASQRDWSNAGDDIDRSESFLYSGSMHDFPGTFEALVLHASSRSTMEYGEYDALSDTYKHIGSRARGWGWVSVRINTRDEDPAQSQQAYVVFGRSNSLSLDDPDQVTIEHYGMNTRTWQTIALGDATEGSLDEDVLRDFSSELPGRRGRRWRATNWGNKIYILGSAKNDVLSRFLSFKPSTKTWRTLPEPNISKRSLDLDECSMFSLSKGLYFADNRRFLVNFHPEKDIWQTLGGDPLWRMGSLEKAPDPWMLIKAASGSMAPRLDSTRAFITPFGRDAFVDFDEENRSSTLLPYRRPGLVSAMTVI